MSRSRLGLAAALAALLCAASGSPQSQAAPAKITVETTAGSAGASLFAAKAEGFFAKRGLDVNILIVNLMPNFPPALVARSADVAFMTTTTFLQAIDGGLDLVAFAGGTVTSHRIADTAVVAYTGAGIKTAQDFIGRKVGVPGIGAALQVMFRYWLDLNHVDSSKVKFVEVSFPTMRDTLAAKSVDAVVGTDPFIAQMVNSGVGYAAVVLNPAMPEGKALVMYTATREWATAHAKEIVAFRDAIVEGAAFSVAHPDKTRDDIDVYAKLPPAIMKKIELGAQQPILAPDQISWWIDVMKRQRMLTGTPDVTKLIWR
ncbi:MAG TPA: ABC transporter substrate-binding protein [Stellaceae bacterium]|nr:ABC transporter substrate-binding protein [Stellaceae bacterium]